MFDLKKISFYYEKDKVILNNITLKLEKNEFYVIMGENGSGKSTLLMLLKGINKLKSGEFYSVFKICPETINMLEKAEIIEYIRAFEYNVRDNKSVCAKCGRVYYMPLPERPDDENDGCFICKGMPDYFKK